MINIVYFALAAKVFLFNAQALKGWLDYDEEKVPNAYLNLCQLVIARPIPRSCLKILQEPEFNNEAF
ncbi:MAG: hypothetical protein ACRC1W_07735 [Shewanella sp.]